MQDDPCDGKQQRQYKQQFFQSGLPVFFGLARRMRALPYL
jgi:hypothetical protein